MNALTLRATAAIALSSAAVVTGCGGGDSKSDDDQVRDAVTSYFGHLGNAKYSDACDELAASARRDVADYAAEQLPEAGSIECAKVYKQIFDLADESQLAKLKKVKVTSITLTGNSATAKVRGATQDPKLKKIQGKWRISSLNFGGVSDASNGDNAAGESPSDTKPGSTAGGLINQIRSRLSAAGYEVTADDASGTPKPEGAVVVALKGGAQVRVLTYKTETEAAKQEVLFAPLEKEQPDQFALATGSQTLYIGTVEEPAKFPDAELDKVVAVGDGK